MKEFQRVLEAYLDIETTGLSPRYAEITVVGIYLISGDDLRFIQIVGGTKIEGNPTPSEFARRYYEKNQVKEVMQLGPVAGSLSF